MVLPGPTAAELGVDGASPFDLLPAIPGSLVITGEHAIFYDAAAQTVTYDGEIAVRTDTGLQLFARRGLLDLKNKFIRVTGDVTVYQGPVLHRGETAIYYYEEQRLDAAGLRTGTDPFLLRAGDFQAVERDGRMVFEGEDAALTTHDSENPSFWVKARKVTVIPGDRVIFRNMKLYAGGVPVFWLPYLSQPVDQELGYHFIPGASSIWGPFLLNSYGIMLGGRRDPETGERRDQWLLSQWHLDLLGKRGIGTGLDLFDTRLEDNENLGWLKAYYINDQDPQLSRNGEVRNNVAPNRYRLQLRHRLELDRLLPAGRTYLDADFTVLSDRYYLEDFNRKEFGVEPNPDNLLALVHQRGRNLFTFWTRVRPNNFYTSDTRLPELALDQVRHPVFDGPILHEGQVLLGIYKGHLPDFERANLRTERATLAADDPRLSDLDIYLNPRSFTRFHTWQEFSLPTTLEKGIHLVPRAGLGYTGYWNVAGGSDGSSRTHAYAGLDASVKFSKSFPDIQNHALGLDGLLHIAQPYANASWFSTSEIDQSFGKIDRLTATTRPRPLSVGRFAAIDDLADWTILRLGMRNRLLTRRDGSAHEWLTLDSYFDWFLEDPEFNRDFSNFYNDLYFHPTPWLSFVMETQIPILGNEGDFTELAVSLRYMPTPDLEFGISHRYLNDHPILENSNRLEYSAYSRINEDWGFGFVHRWEFEDNTLELQQYSIHRTLQNWAVSLGVFRRDNRRDDEFGLMIGFTLTDFPSLHLPFQIDSQ